MNWKKTFTKKDSRNIPYHPIYTLELEGWLITVEPTGFWSVSLPDAPRTIAYGTESGVATAKKVSVKWVQSCMLNTWLVNQLRSASQL